MSCGAFALSVKNLFFNSSSSLVFCLFFSRFLSFFCPSFGRSSSSFFCVVVGLGTEIVTTRTTETKKTRKRHSARPTTNLKKKRKMLSSTTLSSSHSARLGATRTARFSGASVSRASFPSSSFPSSSSSRGGGKKRCLRGSQKARARLSADDDELYPDHRFKSQDERQAAIDRLSPPKENAKKDDGENGSGTELKFVKKVESLRGTTSSSLNKNNNNNNNNNSSSGGGSGKNEFGKLSSSLPPERPRGVGLSEREKNRAVRREDPDLGPSARERSQMKKMERRRKEADERMERILSIIDDSKFGMAFSMVNESETERGGAEPAFFSLSQKKQLEYLVELQKELDDANIGLIEQLFGLWKWTNDTSDEIIENSYELEEDENVWGKKNYQGGKPDGFLGELSEELRNFLSIDITEVSPNQSKVEVYASPEAIIAIIVMLVVSWNFGGWFMSLFVNSDGIPPI